MIALGNPIAAKSQTDGYTPPYQSQIVHYCYPPEEPILDPGLLTQIGISLIGEFSRYFDEANAYIVCLDKSKSDTIDRVNGYLDQYRDMLNRE